MTEKELREDIGQLQDQIDYLTNQIARQMFIQQQAEEEILELEGRLEVFQLDLEDAKNELDILLTDTAGC